MNEGVRTAEEKLRHALRVLWLRSLYWPFWRSYFGIKRGWVAMRGRVNLVTDDELMRVTEPLDEHPEDWEHPCMCATCRSYGDG